jgi:hypothetical protein
MTTTMKTRLRHGPGFIATVDDDGTMTPHKGFGLRRRRHARYVATEAGAPQHTALYMARMPVAGLYEITNPEATTEEGKKNLHQHLPQAHRTQVEFCKAVTRTKPRSYRSPEGFQRQHIHPKLVVSLERDDQGYGYKMT